jgi:hypothetical protein
MVFVRNLKRLSTARPALRISECRTQDTKGAKECRKFFFICRLPGK